MNKVINRNKTILNTSHNNNNHIVVILCLICIMLMFELVRQQDFKAQLSAWKLLPQPERFTELYVEDHLNLPKQIEPGQAYPFSFTVHNMEYREIRYTYEIYAIENGIRTLLTSGSVNLMHNEYKTIEATFIAKRKYNRTQIEISLTNINQTIHFWMDGTLPPVPTATPNPESTPGFISL